MLMLFVHGIEQTVLEVMFHLFSHSLEHTTVTAIGLCGDFSSFMHVFLSFCFSYILEVDFVYTCRYL